MNTTSWVVKAITSAIAFATTVVFLLIPTISSVSEAQESIAQLIEEREEAKLEAAEGVASKRESACLVLDEIIDDIRVVQSLENPSIVADIAPIESDLRRMNIVDPLLASEVSKLRYRFDPTFVTSQYSGTVSVREVIRDSVIELRIERIETLCSS